MNCKNCNQEVLETAKFCTNCGSKIDQVEETVEVIKNDRVDEMVELPISNILDTQKRNYLNKKVIIFAITFTLIISLVSIVLNKTFKNKEKNTTTSTNINKKSEAPKEEKEEKEVVQYKDYPTSIQDAIMIGRKVLSLRGINGGLEATSDIKRDGKNYYELSIYETFANIEHMIFGVLFVDKITGEAYITNTDDPKGPWSKIEGIIANSVSMQSSNTIDCDDYPISIQEAASIGQKSIEFGRVEVNSDIKTDGKTYYGLAIYEGNICIESLLIDKITGEAYIPNTGNPESPPIKIKGTIPKSDLIEHLNGIKPRLSQGEYYSTLSGTWMGGKNGARIYNQERYRRKIGVDNKDVESSSFKLICDETEIEELLKRYKENDVLTKTINGEIKPYKFKHTISDGMLHNSIIASIKNNTTNEEYKELIVFTTYNRTNCIVYRLGTGENAMLEEVGAFERISKDILK